MGQRSWRWSVGLLGSAVLGGCGSSPPTHFYILEQVAPTAPALAAAGGLPVRVESVALAPELDRPEIVSRSGSNRVRVADYDRWAAPLDAQVQRALTRDLAARLPPGLILSPGESVAADAQRSLAVAIDEFYGDASCGVTLQASWSLSTPTAATRNGVERIELAPAAPCAGNGELPAAMSRAVGVLADRLASAIAAP